MANFNISVQLLAQLNQFNRQLSGAQRTLKGFSNVAGRLTGVLAGAFAVGKITEFGKESVDLAAKAEGVERAFKKLDNPNLLASLRKATNGTVSDLKLMQGAVMANNFKIPMDNLSGMMKFAQKRAIETGESVEYFTDSIVRGLARQSVMILDNVGLSSKEIQAEVAKTGDFAKAVNNIIEKSLKTMGNEGITTAERMQQVSASIENLKTNMGQAIIAGGTLGNTLAAITRYIGRGGLSEVKLASNDMWQSINEGSLTTEKRLKAIDEALKGNRKELQRNIDIAEKKVGKDQFEAFRKSGAWENTGSTKQFFTAAALNEKLIEELQKERIRVVNKIELEATKKSLNERFQLEKKTTDKLNAIKTSYLSRTDNKGVKEAKVILPLIELELDKRRELAQIYTKEYKTLGELSEAQKTLQKRQQLTSGAELEKINTRLAQLVAQEKKLKELGLIQTKDVKAPAMIKIEADEELAFDGEIEDSAIGIIGRLRTELDKLYEARNKANDVRSINAYNAQIKQQETALNNLTGSQIQNNKSLQENLNSAGSMVGAIDNTASALESLSEKYKSGDATAWDFFKLMLSTTQSLAGLTTALQVLGVIKDADTAKTAVATTVKATEAGIFTASTAAKATDTAATAANSSVVMANAIATAAAMRIIAGAAFGANASKALSAAIASAAALPFPANLAAMGTALGATTGLLTTAKATSAAMSIPAFANGGIVSGATIGLMGEYAGAKNNPEVIAPLDKLKGMIADTATTGISGDVHFKIEGDTLVGVINNHNRKSKNRR